MMPGGLAPHSGGHETDATCARWTELRPDAIVTGQFHWLDWVVLVLYIAGTSWLAERLTDRGQTIRDFFLGGRKLPWWAVSGSIVASEVSGVTFVAIPAIAFADGGNYTYMMLAIGSILARVL